MGILKINENFEDRDEEEGEMKVIGKDWIKWEGKKLTKKIKTK